MEAEIIIRVVLSLILVCSLAALIIVFVLPKFYKTQLQNDSFLKVLSRIRIDQDNQILIIENKDFQRLVFTNGKQGLNLIGTLNLEDKFIPS